MIELKYLVGAVETPFYNIKLKDFTHSSEFMAEAVISAEIAILEDITDDEWKTSFLSYQGETWRCFTPPAKKKGSTQLEYIYTLTYKPESEILKGIKFLDRVSVLPKLTTGLSVVAYSGGISEFADRLSANLARIGGWNVYVEAGLDDTPKDITIDNQYVWDALATIPDEYKYKYTIKGKKIYIWSTVGYVFPDTFKVGDTISHEFQYGKDNGLYEINKSVTEDKVLGYVRGSGSERNIPLNYYRDSERFAANPCPDYAPALMPKIYTQGDPTAIPPIAPWEVDYYKNDAEIAKGNITEEFVRFDGTDGNEEIYPTIKGVTYNNLPIDELLMVGDIGSDEISDTGKVIDDEFDVTLNPLGFNLSKCISAKGEMIMNMQSGMCSGANFKIVGINGKRTNGVNNAKNYYFFPKLVLDDTYWWGSHSEDVVLGFYGQGQGEQTLAYTKEMKWGEGSILRNDSVQIGDGVNVTLTPLMRDRYSDAEIILQGGGSWPLLYGSSVNLEGLVAIAEQEVKDVNLGYLPAGMWDLVMRISYNTVGTEDIIGGGYLYLPFDKDVPFMTDKGTIVFPDNIQDTSITLTLQKSLGDYDILIPNATLYPQAGDKFVLINADLPDFLVIAAEERLENALKAYRDSHAYNKFNYDINIDSKFINDNPSIASLLKVGNRLKIGSEALNILNVSTEYKRDSIFPNYTVRVSPTTQRVVSTKRATAEKADKVATDTSMILKALVATNRDTINRTVALEVRASGINAGAEPQDRVEIYPNYSNGANQIPSIVDNGNGTVTLGAGQYNLSSNASGAGLINLYTITGGTFNLVNDAQNYIVANYNNGTPIVEVINNVELINETTIIPIYSVYRNGNFLHITNWDALGLALSNKIHQSIVKTQRYRRESGLSLSENGSRNLTLSAGRVWTGAVPITLAEINTAVDNIRFWYKVGGVWTFSLTPTYNNTHYCNGTDLVELTSNRYAINWVFRGVESQKHLYIVVGSGDYTLAQAQGATVPALPVGISSHATLVGKIIVQKGANTAISIQSAFDAQFSYSSPTAHNDMTGIQGGVAGDHQHFTTQEKTIATQSANATRNGYLTSGDWSKFDTAYNDRLKWDGGASSLNAANGRASLGLGTAALNNTSDFLGATAQAVDSAKLGGQLPSYYQVNIAAGLSTDYYTGNKTWADFSTAVKATSLLGYVVGANSPLLATDTIMQAFGKVQGQINARALSTDLTAHTGNGNIHLTNDEKAYLIKLYTYLKFASDNSSLYSTINFYSESGVSAYGIGSGGGGGAGVDIIDNLLSVRADAALSANQGRILKGFVDLKQPQLNGTGLVRMSGTGVTYDNNSYALASSLSNYLGKYETYAMNKYVLESIPKTTTQVGGFGWVDYQTTPYAGGGFLTLYTGGSLRSLLMIFPDYANNDNIKVLTSIDGASWGQQKEIAWKDHNHNGTYALLAGSTGQAFSASFIGVGVSADSTWRATLKGQYPLQMVDSSNNVRVELYADSNQFKMMNGLSIIGYSDLASTTTYTINASTGEANFTGALRQAGQQVLHAGNYSSYALPLSGGTISGTTYFPLTLNTTENIGNYLAFKINNVFKAYVGYDTNTLGAFLQSAMGTYPTLGLLNDNTPYYSPNGGTTKHTLIHSGNIGSQSVNYAVHSGYMAQTSLNEDTLIANLEARTWHNWAQYNTSMGNYNYGLHIGSPDPNYKFQLVGVAGNSNLYLRIKNITYSSWQKIWTDGNLTNTLSNGYLPYWNGSSLVNSVIYQDNGNVGIGTTDLYSNRLRVSRDADFPTRIGVNNQSGTANALSGILFDAWGGSWTIDVPYSSTYTNPLIFKFAGAEERVRFMSDGRVDIGYAGTRSEKLAVNGSGYFADSLNATAIGTAYYGLQVTGSAGGARHIFLAGQYGVTNGFTVKYDGAVMRYNFADGNIGIGMSDEGYRLAANGSGIFYGDLFLKAENQWRYFGNPAPNGGIKMGAGNGSGTWYDALEFTVGGNWVKSHLPIIALQSITATSYIESSSYLKGTSIKIGANWEAIPNGSNELELRYGGVMKAKLSSSGDILAVGGVTAFAV